MNTCLSRLAFAVLGISVLALASGDAAAQVPKPPKGFTALFNGKDFTGWHAMPHFDLRELKKMPEADRSRKLQEWMESFQQHWRIENGELVNDGKGPYATTEKEFGDIELLIEYRTVSGADSGIYLRATPQVQIWDPKDPKSVKHGADKGSGGLWNNKPGSPGKDPLVLADKPMGEWNKFRIIQVGDRTTVFLNDKLVVDNAVMHNFWEKDQPLWSKGPIQLQTHGGEIRWRNIFIREIPPDEAKKIAENGVPHKGRGKVAQSR